MKRNETSSARSRPVLVLVNVALSSINTAFSLLPEPLQLPSIHNLEPTSVLPQPYPLQHQVLTPCPPAYFSSFPRRSQPISRSSLSTHPPLPTSAALRQKLTADIRACLSRPLLGELRLASFLPGSAVPGRLYLTRNRPHAHASTTLTTP